MNGSNYLVNIIELQNTVTSVTGVTDLQQVQIDVTNIQEMVNFAKKQIFTNVISKYNTTPIQVTDDINLCNASLYQNGLVFSGGSGTIRGGGLLLSSGGTAILLASTIGLSTAISFQVGGRQVLGIDGQGNLLYYDPNHTGTQFVISSATLITDGLKVPTGNPLPGMVLTTNDTSGTASWAYTSSLTTTVGQFVSLSSGGVYIGTGLGTDAGRIDSNRNWYLGNPSLQGNNDLTSSNDVTVIGGVLRYQGGGAPNVGSILMTGDSLGTVVLCNLTANLSSFVIGDQIQSGVLSAKVNASSITFTSGLNEIGRFTSDGYLGLCNANPSATLDVGGNAIIHGSLTVNPGTGSGGYVLTETDSSGFSSWVAPQQLFSDDGSLSWTLNSNINAIQGVVNSAEIARFSTGGAYLGVNNLYGLTVSGGILASSFGSTHDLPFLMGTQEIVRFTSSGSVGIGTSNPLYKLQVAGSQSNQGALYVSTNLGVIGSATVNGSLTAKTFLGDGAKIYNIQTYNVGVGSNELDVFQGQTRIDSLAAQIAISSLSTSIFSTITSYDLAGGLTYFSTTSGLIAQTSNFLSAAIGPGAGNVVSSFSTSIGFAFLQQFSTLSSYIVTNNVQFSTLSSAILSVSYADKAYASTVAYSTVSTFVFRKLLGGIAIGTSTKSAFATLDVNGSIALQSTSKIWISSGSLGINYKTGLDLSGAIDVSGLIYSRGLRGIQAPFGFGVGESTTTFLQSGGYTDGQGWRLTVQGDVDISGRIFRNGSLYSLDGTHDVYWVRNGSNIWFGDGGVGIGTPNPLYPLDVAGKIRCYGVDIIQGPEQHNISTNQADYANPWAYQNSNIYYNLGGIGVGTGISSVKQGVFLDISGGVRIQNGPTYMSSLGINIPYGSTLTATTDIFGSLHAQQLTIDKTGTFGGRVTARDFLSLSDQRLKTNITTLTGSLETVRGLRGVRFEWKDSGLKDIGFLAQEVQPLLPEAIGGSEKELTVAYDKIIPYLVESIKELQERVVNLERLLVEKK